MTQSFEGSTLALQHYYDITAVARKLPLLTVYQANEKSFGKKLAIWIATYGDEIKVQQDTAQRLDNAMMKNRGISTPHVLRTLDFGTSAGRAFVVTDPMTAGTVSLRTYLNSHGPIETWQALRLLEQLTEIVNCAHKADFRDLCLNSDNIFIADTERFEIFAGPLGIGLHRADILELKDIPVNADLMRHIPPWEYASSGKLTTAPQNSDEPDRDMTAVESIQSLHPSQLSLENDEHSPVNHASPDNDKTTILPENASITPDANEPNPIDQSSPLPNPGDKSHESIQELSQADISLRPVISNTPEGFCDDVYDIAALIYEALCGRHPYFSEDRDLCEAALTLVQGNPIQLSDRITISDEINDAVMDTIKSPKMDSENEFLSRFAAACSDDERKNAYAAEKKYLSPTQNLSPKQKKLKKSHSVHYSFLFTAIVAILCIAATAFITYRLSHSYKPVDLFAIPEIIPAASEGIDIVISPRTIPPDTSIYLTATDGSLMRLGALPFIYRHQAPGTKLNFVIADESGHNTQVPVTVNSTNGFMVIPVELNW